MLVLVWEDGAGDPSPTRCDNDHSLQIWRRTPTTSRERLGLPWASSCSPPPLIIGRLVVGMDGPSVPIALLYLPKQHYFAHTLLLSSLSLHVFLGLAEEAASAESLPIPAAEPTSFPPGELIYDYCWYPGATPSDPASCCLLSTRRGHPIHLLDALSGSQRCRGYV